jgi:hypothetical protein
VSQTGARPSAGARYALERAGADDAQDLVYRGFVHLPGGDVAVEVRLARSGEGSARASVDAAAIPEGGPSAADLERAAAALVKTAVKAAGAAERPPPRRLTRWRG